MTRGEKCSLLDTLDVRPEGENHEKADHNPYVREEVWWERESQIAYIQLSVFIAFGQGVSATGKQVEIQADEVQPAEINVTIHYADDGPSLESCMVAILNAHLSKNMLF